MSRCSIDWPETMDMEPRSPPFASTPRYSNVVGAGDLGKRRHAGPSFTPDEPVGGLKLLPV
ncbi:uncharacterized protein BDW47DRAFT_101402 [Aspergillus candidus]|uniref:Uncharacterized protein n=1 Tax=Aspergillus candidus TaxID=41067 RepID=A0A2I2FIZ0_ASPCN|nr:hypothetical protein BDW47DRAFT_101402 [Aspergillus candidus]PLB40598.1 hypothetical protein BDW47DRAFT_101402 [Aspergillus candidus]